MGSARIQDQSSSKICLSACCWLTINGLHGYASDENPGGYFDSIDSNSDSRRVVHIGIQRDRANMGALWRRRRRHALLIPETNQSRERRPTKSCVDLQHGSAQAGVASKSEVGV